MVSICDITEDKHFKKLLEDYLEWIPNFTTVIVPYNAKAYSKAWICSNPWIKIDPLKRDARNFSGVYDNTFCVPGLVLEIGDNVVKAIIEPAFLQSFSWAYELRYDLKAGCLDPSSGVPQGQKTGEFRGEDG